MHLNREIKAQQIFMGRFARGSDLLDSLNNLCREKDIRLGRIEALGAVEKARLQYYDQKNRAYQNIALDQPMEILNLHGNISQKEGIPMVHAHLTLADGQGRAMGGHLAPGTTIFACEYILEKFSGPEFSREMDPATGLPLWTA
jgi:hypothetical protein